MSRTTAECLLAAAAVACLTGGDWRHYHGTFGTGVSEEKGLPSVVDDDTVIWKTELPGQGPSSPIVVAGRALVTAGSGPRQDRLHVLCFDAATGKRLWERQLWATGSTICNPFGGVAASTPASDGRRVFALFSSSDLACFDLDGNLQWYRGLGHESPATRNDVGLASSPRVIGDTVIVQLESPAESSAFGIDAGTGQTRWQIRRDPQSWTSPRLLPGKTPAEDLVLLQSRSHLTAHEPRTGREMWSYPAACHTVATGTLCGSRFFLPAGFGLVALEIDRPANRVNVLWQDQRLRCENASPIVHGDKIFTIKAPGILVCADAADGHVLWQLRLKGPIWATPVWAEDRLYIVSHDGLVQVVDARQGKLIASSQIDAKILASPAVADGAMYFRSNAHLWKVGTKGQPTK